MTTMAAAELELSDAELARAAAVLGARCGLRFDARTRELLVDGLGRAARAEGVPATELVAQLSLHAPDELMQAVLRHVTIGETYFFRHPEHFELVRDRIVPELTGGRAPRPLRAWSAGCAAGEEAYSLAIALADAAPGWDVHVLGTDINRAALAAATRGEYGRWSQRGSAGERLRGHVRPLPDGGVAMSPSVRARVRFDYLNLHDPCFPSLLTGTQGLDLIFCRNVLLYFFAEAAQAVLARLAACLVDGGWLVVSALDVGEPPPGLEPIVHAGTPVLRKRATATSAPHAGPERLARTPARGTASLPPPSSSLPSSPPSLSSSAPSRDMHDVHGSAPNACSARMAPSSPPLLRDAKRAADAGDLDAALALGRAAVAAERTPEALHLCALVLAERGDHAGARALLEDAVALDPAYVLGHLSLGLDGDAAHLQRVIDLCGARRDDELLPGPDPLPVSWVRKVARAGRRNRGLT
jgi:chemotaxis protein methyltransferase CheR